MHEDYYQSDVAPSSEQSPSVDLSSVYDSLISYFSVRTNNVLLALQNSYSGKEVFWEHFLTMTPKEIASLKNCGQKTVVEILNIQQRLRNAIGYASLLEPISQTASLPANIDRLLPVILPKLESLSVRAKNGFVLFLKENHDSLSEFYAAVTAPSFNPLKMKNVGRGTAQEIADFIANTKSFLESFEDESSVEKELIRFNTKTLDDILIPKEYQQEITELQQSLGYFPLFAAIKAYIAGLDRETRSILEGCVRMHIDQQLPDREEVAASVGLTPERVRQKRNQYLENLATYFLSIRHNGFLGPNPYSYQMTHINETINATEGTDYDLNFVNWVLASTFDEITLLGDYVKTLTSFYNKGLFLAIVPTELCHHMDFQAFMDVLDSHLAEKHINETRVSLGNVINTHLKTGFFKEYLPAIETACRSILYLHYPVEVDFGQIIFKPNARKNNPLVVEDILRAAGHPLTLEEIYEEFLYQYPERYTELNSFRGNIANNENIIPIGRTSTYALAEWETDENRGGSIRSFVAEYLNRQKPTLALISDIVEYVCKFRPTTDEKNIVSNIALDRSGQFAFYYRNGERYIGLAAGEYPIEYFPVESSAKTSLANSLWFPMILSFIEEKGRFPFSSGVEDKEKQLCQFWFRQERLYANGELDSHALMFYELVTSQYGSLRIDKKGYDWKQTCERVSKAFDTKDAPDMDDEAVKWLSRNLREYKSNRDSMPEWKKEGIEHIMSLCSDN